MREVGHEPQAEAALDALARQQQLGNEVRQSEQIEQELQASREELLLALEAAQMGTWHWNLITNSVTWSAVTEAIHGFAPGEFPGTYDAFLADVHPDDRDYLTNAIAKSLIKETDHHVEYRIVWRDGSVHWLEGRGRVYLDSCNKPTHMIGVCTDISKRKQTEERIEAAERRFTHLAVHAPVGILQTDLAGNCIFVNERWCELAGVSAEHALEGDWREAVHPEDHERIVAGWLKAVSEGRPYIDECRLKCPDGQIRWISVAASALLNADGAATAYIGIVSDISERRQAAEALKAEQELLRQTIELQERERQLIVYEIHDGMIQYATGALMFLEAYKSQLEGRPDADQIEPALKALRQALAEGRRVINGIRTPLLDDAGVVPAIQSLIDTQVGPTIEIEFLHDDEFPRATPELESAIFRIAQETLANAAKHSRSPKVQMTLSLREERILFQIEDWGIGFDAGQRLRGVHGLRGIKERVRLLSGRFKLESKVGQGTRVEVDLPFVGR